MTNRPLLPFSSPPYREPDMPPPYRDPANAPPYRDQSAPVALSFWFQGGTLSRTDRLDSEMVY